MGIELTYQQFVKYIEQNGMTKCRLSQDWQGVGKEVWFFMGLRYDCENLLSSYVRDTDEKNSPIYQRTGVDIFWCSAWKESYKGNFIIEKDMIIHEGCLYE